MLSVFPDYNGDNTGMVPKSIGFSISYYQIDNDMKRIIIVEMFYDQFEEPNAKEMTGETNVEYNLTFSFQPLSHKDLTINFAFSWHFYVVLYLIVGMIAVIIVFIYTLYHRLAARPPNGKNFASWKFFSYLKLTISPAINGIILALIPLLIGNFFISVFIAGHLFSTKTGIFDCHGSSDSECPYTLFDTIKDNPSNVNVDYSVLRTGRCGTTMLVMGAYIMFVSLGILIPDKSNENKVPEAYDGNIWEYY